MEKERVTVTGAGCHADYADSVDKLYSNLLSGKTVDYQPLFPEKTVQETFGLAFSPYYTGVNLMGNKPDDTGKTKRANLLKVMIGTTESLLEDAGLSRDDLKEDDIQVFWGTPGNTPNLPDFLGFINGSDKLDLLMAPEVRMLEVDSFRDDALRQEYRNNFGLRRNIQSYSTACSSASSAAMVASRAIQLGKIKRAVILSWQEITLFDLLFLSSLNILSKGVGIPFSKKSDGMTLGFGMGALLLESESAAAERGKKPYYAIRSMKGARGYTGSVNTPTMSVPFRSISQCVEGVLEESNLKPEDIDCIFPHGNGTRGNDLAEAKAYDKMFGELNTPIANYTHQLSYTLSASAIFDMIIAADSFRNNRVIPFVSPEPPDDGENLNFVCDGKVREVEINHILKTAIGIDGSIVATVLDRV